MTPLRCDFDCDACRGDESDDTDWDGAVRRGLRIPFGWKVRPEDRGDYWTLRAAAPRTETVVSLPCGHRSMQVTATTLPLAVARMAQRVRFHREDCAE